MHLFLIISFVDHINCIFCKPYAQREGKKQSKLHKLTLQANQSLVSCKLIKINLCDELEYHEHSASLYCGTSIDSSEQIKLYLCILILQLNSITVTLYGNVHSPSVT